MSRVIIPNSSSLTPYHKMLSDYRRNKFFYDRIAETVKDRIVLDIGTGSGIMAAYALRHGAKFVYAIDRNGNLLGSGSKKDLVGLEKALQIKSKAENKTIVRLMVATLDIIEDDEI